MKPIGYASDFISGFAFKSDDFTNLGLPVIKIKNIRNGKVTTEDSQCVPSNLITNKLNKFYLCNGDVLIAMTGQGSVGRVGRLYAKENESPVLNQRVGKFVPDEVGLNLDYLYYVISTKSYESHFFAAGSGSGQPNLSPATILSVEIPYPPYDLQCGIASVLKSLDDKIELNRQINQTLEQIAQAIFKSWFVDFEPVKAKIEAKSAGRDPERAAMCAISGKSEPELDQLSPENYQRLAATAALFPDALVESELGLIPKGWEVGMLQDLLILQRGFDLPASDRKEGTFPIIAASGPAGLHDQAMVKAPGVVTGRSGVLGKVFLVLENYWPLNTTLWVKEFRRASPLYAFHLLKTFDFSIFNAGSAVPTLNRNHIHGLRQLVPANGCVSEFEKHAGLLFKAIQDREKESQHLATLRDTLLPKLLSGELNVDNLPLEATA